jgi:glutamate racemase
MQLSGDNMIEKDLPIGFFDSGVGGISVLKEAVKSMPLENYIYYGDSINAPYGTKDTKTIKELTFKGIEFLYNKSVKAIVVACNTATSAAIKDLREMYKDIPVIGIEPAVKPAVKFNKGGNILIMATPATLSQSKYFNLIKEYKAEDKIISLPCEGLAELIEDGNTSGDIIKSYLMLKLKEIDVDSVETIVLGCTHYPFIKEEINNIFGPEVPIIDGSCGTVHRLSSRLAENNLFTENKDNGSVEIFNSKGEAMVQLSYELLHV